MGLAIFQLGSYLFLPKVSLFRMIFIMSKPFLLVYITFEIIQSMLKPVVNFLSMSSSFEEATVSYEKCV